jgi:predicted acyltransferase
MFWIIGGDAIISEIGKLSNNGSVIAVAEEFSEHMEWAGFRYYDLIFPLFLFMIGVAIPFSLGKRLEAGQDRKTILRKVAGRALILIAFGLIYNGLLEFKGWDHIRFFGVLQRQGFGYCAAAVLFLYTKPRTQVYVFVGILLGFWALMALVPVPGTHHGDYSQWGNVANYVDRLLMSRHQMYEKYGDPEGPVSMIPSVATALIGVFAGTWLKSSRPPELKAMGLALAGLACLAAGVAWAPVFPVIKKIWTSSYVLVAGGSSLELLALFYWIIDVKGYSKWSFPFVVIGMNAITIYLLTALVDFGNIADRILGGALKHAPTYQPLGMAIGVVVLEWLLLYFLYRQKVFLRV